ncbi:MAG: GAF domain-containing protein, partial [Proteobacteria bacterium]
MGSEREEAFDRLASLAAFILKVPLTIVSLISDKQQFFKAGYGLPSPYDQVRSLPIDESICRYTLADDPIIAGDAKLDPLVANQPIAKTLEIAAYIAIPMKDHRGYVLGAFCAIDTKPRAWSSDDVNIMRELTKSVMTEIHLREQLRELETEKISRETVVAALTHDLRTPVSAAKMASAALQEPDIDVEEQKQMIEIISRNMDRADRMIHDILDASRLKAGEGVP